MRPFGDPNFPKRNLTTGTIFVALSSFLFGSTAERIIWGPTHAADYVFLVLWVGMFFGAIKSFRLGLATVPPDPKHTRSNRLVD
jgi:MFS-type transporter involved in bile tolerance (Atg22 family)